MENHESLGMESRTVKEVSVEGVQRRTKPKKHFVFCVKVTWSDGTVNLVYRRYREFLHLQTILYQAFPGSLGRPGTKRKNFTPLPSSFSSRVNVGEIIFRRMEQVNYFLKQILALETKVAQSKHIKCFLTPTPEDLEPRKMTPKKTRFKKSSRSKFTKTMRGRLQRFGKTRVFGNNISSPIVLEHFVVMDDYKKQAKSDISLKKGTLVDVIEKRQCGWWLVDADGEVGWAPALFLEPADEMAEVSNVTTYAMGRGEFYVTSKKYVAVEDDELSFDIGVNLQIVEKNFDGWWKASYLGREGWVPAMYLKKLGQDERRNSRTGRRKSRLISSTELRNVIEEDDDMIQEVIGEETVKESIEEDKKASLPRRISAQVFSAIGKRESKTSASDTIKEEEDEIDSDPRKTSADEGKTVGTMVEMSSVFLQLHKPDKKAANTSPRPRTPERSSPRPGLQRRAISTVIVSTNASAVGANEDSKDDLEIPRSRSLDSIVANNSKQKNNSGSTAPVSFKWIPETKNGVSTSLPDVYEEKSEAEDDTTSQPNPELPDISTKLPALSDASHSVNMEGSENESDSDSGSCDISHGFCEQPYDTSTHFQRNSFDENSSKATLPKRSPPLPPSDSQRSMLDSPRVKSPTRSPPSPSSNKTYPTMNMKQSSNEEQRERISIQTFPRSVSDRKIVRQDSIEKETATELNEQIQFWCSSDESEPEWIQTSSDRVVHPQTEKSPAIVIDETEKRPVEEGEICLPLDDGVASTESFEIEINLQNGVEQLEQNNYSSDVHRVRVGHEVDSEMYLAKDSFVKVMEKASTGWWFVQSEEGVRGWTRSCYIDPIPQVRGKSKQTELNEEEKENEEEDEDPDEEDDDEEHQESDGSMSCRVIEDYTGDPDNQEIDLLEDEVLKILHKTDSGWWCVQTSDGEVGWAPSTFLEVLEDEDVE